MKRSGAWRTRADASMLVRTVLRATDALARPLRAAGIDVAKVKVLLETRLLLDLNPSARGTSSEGASFTVGLTISLLVFSLAGIVPGIVALVSKSPAAWIGVGQALHLVQLTLLLFAQYGSLLIDRTDLSLAAPRPVSGRTVFAARLLHLSTYVVMLSAASAFFPTLLGVFAFPSPCVLVYPLCTLLSTLLAVGCVGLAYSLGLLVFGPRAFQRAMFWLQIAMVSGVPIFVQVAAHSTRFDTPALDDVESTLAAQTGSALWLAPPWHQIGLYELCGGALDREHALRALLAIALPLALLYATLRIASRHFVLALLADASSGARGERARAWTDSLPARLLRRRRDSRLERAGTEFTLALAWRERTFVRGYVPQIFGLSMITLVFSLPHGRHTPHLLGDWAHAGLLMLTLLPPACVELSRFSEHAEAHWLLRALPVRDPSALLRGGLRGLLLVAVVPAFVVVGAASLALRGFPTPWGTLYALVLALTGGLHMVARLEVAMPFTAHANPNDVNWKNASVMFLGMAVIVGVLAPVLVLTSLHPISMGLGMCAAAVALAHAWKRCMRLTPRALSS